MVQLIYIIQSYNLPTAVQTLYWGSPHHSTTDVRIRNTRGMTKYRTGTSTYCLDGIDIDMDALD